MVQVPFCLLSITIIILLLFKTQLPTLNFALFIYLFIYSWKNMEEVGNIKTLKCQRQKTVLYLGLAFFFSFLKKNLINKYMWGQNAMGTYYKPYKSLNCFHFRFCKVVNQLTPKFDNKFSIYI